MTESEILQRKVKNFEFQINQFIAKKELELDTLRECLVLFNKAFLEPDLEKAKEILTIAIQTITPFIISNR